MGKRSRHIRNRRPAPYQRTAHVIRNQALEQRNKNTGDNKETITKEIDSLLKERSEAIGQGMRIIKAQHKCFKKWLPKNFKEFPVVERDRVYNEIGQKARMIYNSFIQDPKNVKRSHYLYVKAYRRAEVFAKAFDVVKKDRLNAEGRLDYLLTMHPALRAVAKRLLDGYKVEREKEK